MTQKVTSWLSGSEFVLEENKTNYAKFPKTKLSIIVSILQVEPFILKHKPGAFAHSASVHFQGKSDDWLKKLVPMLRSNSRQSQSLAAFHFAMETAVKKEQNNLKVRGSKGILSYIIVGIMLFLAINTQNKVLERLYINGQVRSNYWIRGFH